MFFRKLIIIFILLTLPVLTTTCRSTDNQPEVNNNSNIILDTVFNGYCTCAAYYFVMVDAGEDVGAPMPTKIFSDLHNDAIEYAEITASKNRSEKEAVKLTHETIALRIKEMAKEINKDYRNFDPFANKYTIKCLPFKRPPDIVIKEYTEAIERDAKQ